MGIVHIACLDVERSDDARFSGWYEQHHVPQMLARRGWLSARRYECVDGEPRYVTIYQLDEEALHKGSISEAPYRSPDFARTGIRNYHARTYREIHDAGEHVLPPTWVNIVSVDMDAAYAEAFNHWYNDVHVPEILACPGWLGNRRYQCIDGQPRFLAVYDLEDEKRPFGSKEWRSAVGWDEHVEHIRGYHGFRVYRLIHDSDS